MVYLAKAFPSYNEIRNQDLQKPIAAFSQATNSDSNVFSAKPLILLAKRGCQTGFKRDN